MEALKTNKRIVRKELNALVKQGLSKREIYESCSEKYKDNEFIANTLEKIPSLQKRKENKWLRFSLITTLSLFTFFELIFNLTPFLLYLIQDNVLLLNEIPILITKIFIDVFFLIIVIKYYVRFYNWMILWGLFITLANAFPFFNLKDTPQDNFMFWVYIFFFILSIINIIIAFVLSTKLSSNYIEKKERYIKEDGTHDTRISYIFRD